MVRKKLRHQHPLIALEYEGRKKYAYHLYFALGEGEIKAEYRRRQDGEDAPHNPPQV